MPRTGLQFSVALFKSSHSIHVNADLNVIETGHCLMSYMADSELA